MEASNSILESALQLTFSLAKTKTRKFVSAPNRKNIYCNSFLNWFLDL